MRMITKGSRRECPFGASVGMVAEGQGVSARGGLRDVVSVTETIVPEVLAALVLRPDTYIRRFLVTNMLGSGLVALRTSVRARGLENARAMVIGETRGEVEQEPSYIRIVIILCNVKPFCTYCRL